MKILTNKIDLLSFYIFSSFILIWVSINSGPIDIYKFFDNFNFLLTAKLFKSSAIYTINFLRATFPIIILIINITIILYKIKDIKFINFSKNYTLVFFYIFSFFQILALVLAYDNKFFDYFYWNLLMLSILTLFTISISLNKNINYFFYISFFILWVVLIAYGSPTFVVFFSDTNILYESSFLNLASSTFEQPNPRVTGLSRTALLLYILHFVLFFKNYENKYFKFINLILFLLLSTIIILFSSRGAIGGLLITNILFLIFFKRMNIFKKFMFFLSILLFPILFAEGIHYYKQENLLKSEVSKELYKEQKKRHINEKYLAFISSYAEENKRNNKYIQKMGTLTIFLSERNIFWKAIYNKSKENLIIGFVTQADRKFTGMPVSQVFLYALITGGVLSLIGLIIFLILIFKKILILTFENKKNFLSINNYYIVVISFLIISFFTFRGLFENTFLIFGIDFLMFSNHVFF